MRVQFSIRLYTWIDVSDEKVIGDESDKADNL